MGDTDDGLDVLDDQSQAFLIALTDLGYGVVVLGDQDRVIGASDRVEAITGYRRKELLDLVDPAQVYAPEHQASVRARIAARRAGHPRRPSFEAIIVDPRGGRHVVEHTAIDLVSQPDHWVILLHDVEERIERERTLQLLGAALAGLPVAVILLVLQVAGDPTSVQVVAANQAATTITGLPIGPGTTFGDLYEQLPDDVLDLFRHGLTLAEGELHVQELTPTLGANPNLTRARCSLANLGDHTFALFVEDISAQAAAEQDRRQLLERIIESGDVERRRIADGLHDDIIQRLAASTLLIQSARRNATDEAGHRLGLAQQALVDTIDELRHLVFELAPPELDAGGLRDLLQAAADHVFAGTDTSLSVDCTVPADLEAQAARVTYRIAVEALSNARRHAEASAVNVVVSYDGERLHGAVTDDGVGVAGIVERPGHLGVRAMRERAEMLQGEIAIEPGPEGIGTTVAWWVPAALAQRPPEAPPGRDWRPPEPSARRVPTDLGFDALIEGSPDIVSCFDRSLRHVYVNRAVEEVTGAPRATFIRRTNRELGMPDHLATAWDEALLGVLRTGTPVTQLFTYETPVGPVEFHASLVPESRDGEVVRVWSVARPLTGQPSSDGP